MKIEMELLSDAIPGSGEGLAGIIDGDITYDELGIPYIPAKRIKGILRESARELEDAGLLTTPSLINKLFGEVGTKNGTDLKISDGYIDDYEAIRDFLKACIYDNSYKQDLAKIFNHEAVLSFYSYNRSQTTINDYGVAEPDSLRTFRILKRGLKFKFDVACPNGYDEDLENILKVTRLFGTSRTRGTGEIRLKKDDSVTLEEPKNVQPLEPKKFEGNDLCTITLNIHNLGQLLVSSQVGKTQESEKYIPGSFILGAFASKFIATLLKRKQPHEDDDFKAIFLHSKVIFSNGYPCPKNGKAYFPTPASFVKEKDKEKYLDLTEQKDIDKIKDEKIQTKGNIGNFVDVTGQTVETFSTITEMEYHHWRPYDRSIGCAKEGKGDFFQFNVIRADQHFQSFITGEYRYLEKIMEGLEKDNIFYLGKSKTAQYGKCVFQAEIKKQNGSQKKWEKDKEAVITLQSDLILRNENGANVADPKLLVEEIKIALGCEKSSDSIKLMNSFLNVNKVGGYLGVWNMPKIQVAALAAGSEIICQNNTGDDIEIKKLENRSYGYRTEEGFGRIKIDWHNKLNIDKVEKPTISYHLTDNLSPAQKLVQHILDKELEKAVENYAVQQFEDYKKKGAKVTNSFFGRLKLLINHADDLTQLNANIKFSKRAFDQMAKLEKLWPLSRRKYETSKEVIEFDLSKFEEKLIEIHKPGAVSRLREIMNKLEIQEDYIKNDQDYQLKMFKLFANHFLTLARLHNRKED